ncbi:hypothetical protein HYALB_00000514 [Hymenoscyphus albidus]|uniref:Uncharacterized protein n=1 Tax=Hymenoscyphus albidus TaxID=595503 RepID=A0A9N9M3A0_9HELO|nr:hypothetical protein HYALB_00000514 [Hymenoscyphus albidus]
MSGSSSSDDKRKMADEGGREEPQGKRVMSVAQLAGIPETNTDTTSSSVGQSSQSSQGNTASTSQTTNDKQPQYGAFLTYGGEGDTVDHRQNPEIFPQPGDRDENSFIPYNNELTKRGRPFYNPNKPNVPHPSLKKKK